MPYAKRKYRKKRGDRKRPYRRSKQLTIRKSPMPLKFATKLRYVENFTVDAPASGLAASYVFNAGDLNDPNVTSVGHQPRGFDQIIAMYDHFVVIGSKISVTLSAATTETANQICGVALRDGSTVDTDPNDYLEGGTCRSVTIVPDQPSRTVTMTYSPKKFLGRSHPMSDPNLKGTATTTPTESAFYHVFSAGLNATNPTTVTCTAIIDYLAVFIEPKDVAQS